MEFSISFKKGTKNTSISHNNRDLTDSQKKNDWHKHIDFEKSDKNIYLEQTDIREKYDELFGEALEQYNAKQKRADRRIDDYFEKVRKDKKLETQREFIVQIGTIDDFRSTRDDGSSTGISEQQAEENQVIANKILVEYFKDFEKRNPNLHVYNAVIHNDEASPHLHLNVVPVATGYKRGMQKQPSFNKALQQQGLQSDKDNGRVIFNNFREQEVQSVENLMRDFNWQRKEVGTNSIKDIHEYKEIMSEISDLRKTLKKERESVSEELKGISIQKAENERKRAEMASEREEIEKQNEKLNFVFEKDVVPLRNFKKIDDNSYKLSDTDFVDLYNKAMNATNSKRSAEMYNELYENVLEQNVKLELENLTLKERQKVDVSAIIKENKELKKENRSLKQRLNNLKNAFQSAITSLSLRFGLLERDMGISEHLEVLDKEKSNAYYQTQSAPQVKPERFEIDF